MRRDSRVVLDTNVYVTALREGVAGPTFARIQAWSPRTFLASVVSAELRAGAIDETGRRAVRDLTDRFDRLGRVVTPNADSWSAAGDLLGQIRQRDSASRDRVKGLWNDALLALSARQIGAVLVTGNVRDFDLLRRFARFEFERFEG
jgi:predicted nucleic acid-binding protein